MDKNLIIEIGIGGMIITIGLIIRHFTRRKIRDMDGFNGVTDNRDRGKENVIYETKNEKEGSIQRFFNWCRHS